MITKKDIEELFKVSNKCGLKEKTNEIKLLIWKKGINSHKPLALPKGFSAVYVFKYKNKYLKVGKANSKSKARYISQHYNPKSCKSNLSKSINSNLGFKGIMNKTVPGKWLKENTTRYNILIPNSYGKNFVNFAEAYFLLKCNPTF
ncbi:MAG: hypothetical protein IPG78_03685 [Ignavibacteria bacterium]|nr:hypothetical protein [Ignavibacteria bacterium]